MMLPPGSSAEGGKEYIFDACPRCGGKKFYWNVDAEKGICFSGSCGLAIRGELALSKILKSAGWDYLLPMLPTTGAERVPAPTWAAQDLVPILGDMRGRLYLTSKRLSPKAAQDCNVLVSPGRSEIYAPLHSVCASLPPAYMARSVFSGGKFSWMFRGEAGTGEDGAKSCYFFASPHLIRSPYRKPIVIVEGVGDLLRQPVVVDNGIAVCGATINPLVGRWLAQRATEVIVWGDNDAGGDALYRRVRKEMKGWGTPTRRFRTEEKDPGESVPRYKITELSS